MHTSPRPGYSTLTARPAIAHTIWHTLPCGPAAARGSLPFHTHSSCGRLPLVSPARDPHLDQLRTAGLVLIVAVVMTILGVLPCPPPHREGTHKKGARSLYRKRKIEPRGLVAPPRLVQQCLIEVLGTGSEAERLNS